ncbi:MAG: ABC transporter permease [Coriobacteriales bacterium]|jgi:NitT/TauT family transport system permease protein|nr:ABC transporter permease [Coriobacteriales bacterium]
MGKTLENLQKLAFGAIPILAFFALWQAVTALGILPSSIIPQPSRVFTALVNAFAQGDLLRYAAISVVNVLAGLALSIFFGISVGLLAGIYLKRFSRYLLPFLRVCEKLNPFALLPIFVLIFGIGRVEKIAVVFWVSVWPLLFSTIDGLVNLDVDTLRSARSMGAKRLVLLRKVIVPMMTPTIFSGIKSSAQVAFFMIIASEMMASSTGLGWYYMKVKTAYQPPLMYGIVLFITAMAILVNLLFTLIEKRFSKWRVQSLGTAE